MWNSSRLLARLSVFVALASLASPIARAAEYEVPPQLQISILLKVLVYDRSLASRARDGLTLGVVFDPRSESSRVCRDGFSQAFKESARQLAGTAIALVDVPQDLLASEAEKGLDIAYVCGGAKTSAIIEIAKKKMLITFAPDEAAVQQGVAIGLVPRDGKPKLLINVTASISSGMQLDPQILRLAELVRGEK